MARSKELALRAIARGGPNRDMFVRLHMGYVVGLATRKKQTWTIPTNSTSNTTRYTGQKTTCPNPLKHVSGRW